MLACKKAQWALKTCKLLGSNNFYLKVSDIDQFFKSLLTTHLFKFTDNIVIKSYFCMYLLSCKLFLNYIFIHIFTLCLFALKIKTVSYLNIFYLLFLYPNIICERYYKSVYPTFSNNAGHIISQIQTTVLCTHFILIKIYLNVTCLIMLFRTVYTLI